MSLVDVRPVPTAPDPIRRWARRHGVADVLSEPAGVLVQRVGTGDPLTREALENRTLAELFTLPPEPAPRRVEIVSAARRYLQERAESRLLEPVAALDARLRKARRALAGRVPRRERGTYLPLPATVAEEPLRIEYAEAADFPRGTPGVQVAIAVEEEPLHVQCSCHAGECVHVLSAFNAALAMLSDPANAERRKLEAALEVPSWRRFLRAFGDELARREVASQEDARLAWRVEGNGPETKVVPVVQTRLEGGDYSAGQRLSLDELRRRRELLRDPQDAGAFRMLEDIDVYTPYRLSQARAARALEALVGHPRVFLARGPAVEVIRRRLRVSVEPRGGGVSVSFLLGGRSYRAAELRALAGGGEDLIAVDEPAKTVTVCTLDGRTQALLAAFGKHPACFPPESYDELVRGFEALQESVELVIPDNVARKHVAADERPLLRLIPQESGGLEVDVWILPVEEGPEFRPGEEPDTVLVTTDERRLAAHRDLEREAANANAILDRLMPGQRDADEWITLLDEGTALEMLAALREVGDAVVVEWPEPDKRIVVNLALHQELRVRITDQHDWFGVDGEVQVDGDIIPLAVLLDAVRHGRRFIRIGPGRFAEIEAELRRRVAAADDVLHQGRQGLEVALAGVEQIAELVDDPARLQAAKRWCELLARIDAARAHDPEVPCELTATLRPYQVEGYMWLARLAAWGTGACLADDMGLGKTVQALALLLARAARGPALVIAPTSVGPTWIREAERFAPSLRPKLYRGMGRAALLETAAPGDLFVTSYALSVRDADALAKVRFGTLVVDEAQAIKNSLTRRARAVRSFDAELRVALTGTPVENHLGELWSLMRVVAPGLLGSWEHFRERFAGPIERDHNQERSAALARLVRPFLLRRTKAEVAPELPSRTEIERFVDMSQAERRLYEVVRREALESIAAGAGDKRFTILAALTRLRRLACHPRLLDERSRVPSSKLAALLETVRELREEGHRALVFSQFTTHLALVREALDKEGVSYEYLDGSTPSEERTRRIDAFQAGSTDLFLISLKAGGTGLNLTAADYVVHLDPWWNPAVEDQATDRAHRIGQTRAVTVIRLIMRGTIEEAVLSLHDDKRALAASVFDEEGSAARLSTDELATLIRAGTAEAPANEEEESDAAGDEVVSSDEGRHGNGDGAAERLAADLLGHLAKERGVADPRYDVTLSTYARSLRRFTRYAAAHPELGTPTAETIDRIVDDYLSALREGRWPAPVTEQLVGRTVTNHLKEFVRSQRA